MRVCVLMPVLDAFKGGNHLPLLGACSSVQFMVLTNRTNPIRPALPANVQVVTIPAHIGPYYYGFADALFARSVLRAYPPDHSFWKQFDVIHLNQTFGPALHRLIQTGRPMCLLIHHPVSVDRELAVTETHGLTSLLWRCKYALLQKWQRSLCRSGVPIVTVSHTAAARIASDYSVNASAIHVVPNGIEEVSDAVTHREAADFDVIAIGSFVHPRKGFPYLLDAYRALSSAGYRVADVGRRSDEQRAMLADLPHVQVFGTVQHDALSSLLSRSSVLISTALYEGFGLSLIEALARGLPAFAFGGGAVQEVLSPVDPDLVVPLRDTAELVRRVESFLRLPAEQQQQKREQYRQSVLERYSLVQSGQALQALYRLLCSTMPIFRS